MERVQHALFGEVHECERAVFVARREEIAFGGLGMRGKGERGYAGEAHDETVVGGDFFGGFEFVEIKETERWIRGNESRCVARI